MSFPESMRRIRVVVTGDNHLAPRLSRLKVTRAQQRRQCLRDAISAVVSAAISRQADLFIQAGDLFDNPDPNNEDREFVAGELARLKAANIAVFAVSGNHDMPRQSTEQGGVAPLGVYSELGGLRYFHDTRVLRPVLLERNDLRIAIAGLSNDPARRAGEDPLADYTLDDPDGIIGNADVGIIIMHAAIEGCTFLSEAECIIRESSLRQLRGFQVLVTGHIHQYQHRKFGDIDTIICGPSERMDFGDPSDAPGYAWLEIAAEGLSSEQHIRFIPQPRATVDIEAVDIWDSVLPSDGAVDRIIERIAPHISADTMVRVRLQGAISRADYRAFDLVRLRRWGQENCFTFDLSLDRLLLLDDLVHAPDGIVRGERIEPRDILAEACDQQIIGSDDEDTQVLWQSVKNSLLQRFDDLLAHR
jgi:DNA repair protein SbcD/Mre11